MPDPYTLHLGDCFLVLPSLPDNSVDAVVTDPPYGLSFMGKNWDHGVPGEQFWREVLRVAKPGAHLLAFGGTRTYHRLACAIEDAGWEVRDCLMWVYGSGFPKSKAVDKAIDKANGREFADRYALGRHIRERREACGFTRAQVNEWFGYADGCEHWERQDPHGARVPTLADWSILQERLGLSNDWRELVERIEAEREVVGQKTAGMGSGKTFGMLQSEGKNADAAKVVDITAPATPEARQWAGWGTALKPAWEPVILARKPLASAGVNVLRMVESQLRDRGVTGDIQWKPESVNGAGKRKNRTNSSSTGQPQVAETSAERAGESGTQNAEPQNLTSSRPLGKDGTKPTPEGNENLRGNMTSDCAETSLKPTAESAHVAERQSMTSSPLTTSTAEEQSTEKESTAKFMPNCGAKDSRPDTESFAGIATGLTGSMATVRINRDSSGMFLWPTGLPEFVPGSPLTVAENVLRYGTGAINVDGCRVEAPEGITTGGNWTDKHADNANGEWGMKPQGRATPHASGRWPANLLHSGEPEVVGLFPETKSKTTALSDSRYQGKQYVGNGYYGTRGPENSYTDTGSAARFFQACPDTDPEDAQARLVYCAKASKRDRDEGCEGLEAKRTAKLAGADNDRTDLDPVSERFRTSPSRNHHPTVKPTSLMRYLVRLITPPGGVVLDPFMGSGSTGKACGLEGFGFIGIEQSPEYMPIASARVAFGYGTPDPVPEPAPAPPEPAQQGQLSLFG